MGLRVCISNQPSGDEDVAGLGISLSSNGVEHRF